MSLPSFKQKAFHKVITQLKSTPTEPAKDAAPVKPEERSASLVLDGEDIQALAINLKTLKKTAKAPPRRSSTPRLVCRTRPVDARVGVASRPLDLPGGIRYDAQGMILPHSILGSLEDFRNEVEDRGKTEIIKHIPDLQKQHSLEAWVQRSDLGTKYAVGQQRQNHALLNWEHHMAARQRHQSYISRLLEKPEEDLLINRMKKKYEPKDKDQTEEHLEDMEDMDVEGSSEALLSVQRSSLLTGDEREEEEGEYEEEEGEEEEYWDQLVFDEDLIPRLRVGGELACWTGSTTSHKGVVGISIRLLFETIVEKSVSSHLELKNEGGSAIYYSWEKLPIQPSFNKAPVHTQYFYFDTTTAVILPGQTQQIEIRFKSVSSGIKTELWQLHTHPVLLGGASLLVTLRGVALFQDKTTKVQKNLELKLQHQQAVSVCRSLVWEVMKGVCTPERPSSPCQLHTSDEESFSIRNPNLHYDQETVETLKNLWEQARRSQVTVSKDTRTSGSTWDLSIESLKQVLLSLPTEGTDVKVEEGLCREDALSQYNSLVKQLHQVQLCSGPLTTHTVGVQLWRELLYEMDNRAQWLHQTLGDSSEQPEIQHRYQHQLRGQVYVLTEKMIGSLTDFLDEAEEKKEMHTK